MDSIPAFPVTSGGVNCMGMTLRDYFAAQAMPDVMHDWRVDRANSSEFVFDEDVWLMARDCYLMADAMLKAREGVRNGHST